MTSTQTIAGDLVVESTGNESPFYPIFNLILVVLVLFSTGSHHNKQTKNDGSVVCCAMTEQLTRRMTFLRPIKYGSQPAACLRVVSIGQLPSCKGKCRWWGRHDVL